MKLLSNSIAANHALVPRTLVVRTLDEILLELHDLAVEDSKLSLGASASGVYLDGEILGETSGGGEEGEGLVEDGEDCSEVVRAAKGKGRLGAVELEKRGDSSQVLHDGRATSGDGEVGVLEDVLLREAPVTAKKGKGDQPRLCRWASEVCG
jgi:hypothetical protein